MLKHLLTTTAAAAVLLPAAAQAGTPVLHYKGKTKEGTKISFVLDEGWLDGFSTSLTTTCASAQGGTPRVTFTTWDPPFKYRLGRTSVFKYGDPTKHYHLTTHRRKHHRIVGKLSMNYSLLNYSSFSGYYLEECLGTGTFSLRPKR